MARLYNIIKDETPQQYTFDFVPRAIEIIREVIKRVVYQQKEEAVQEFLREKYPAIKKEAKECGATVY